MKTDPSELAHILDADGNFRVIRRLEERTTYNDDDGRLKFWYEELDINDKDAEIKFLKDEIYVRSVEPGVDKVTAFERYSARV